MKLIGKRGRKKGLNVYKAESIEEIIDHYNWEHTRDCRAAVRDSVWEAEGGEMEIAAYDSGHDRPDIIDITAITGYPRTIHKITDLLKDPELWTLKVEKIEKLNNYSLTLKDDDCVEIIVNQSDDENPLEIYGLEEAPPDSFNLDIWCNNYVLPVLNAKLGKNVKEE